MEEPYIGWRGEMCDVPGVGLKDKMKQGQMEGLLYFFTQSFKLKEA